MGLFFVIFLTSFLQATGKPANPGIFNLFPILFVFYGLTIILMVGLPIFYIMHIMKNNFDTPELRIIWVILVLMGGIVAMPIYFYLYIWRGAEKQKSQAKSAKSEAPW
jgi:prolipoprotein diacylglyceryltransferase